MGKAKEIVSSNKNKAGNTQPRTPSNKVDKGHIPPTPPRQDPITHGYVPPPPPPKTGGGKKKR